MTYIYIYIYIVQYIDSVGLESNMGADTRCGPDSRAQWPPRGQGVVNAALPAELRTPEHREITMGREHQRLK